MPTLRTFTLILITATLALTARSAAPATAPTWTNLFDAQLSQWELWMGAPHKSVVGLPPGTPLSEDGHQGTPLGLGNDPKRVFSMIEQNGEPVLYITGEIFGGLTTKAEFENYHVRLEVKWGQKIWEPRPTKPRDSGLLFHCTGPHGTFWNVWMTSLEYQIQEKDMGDLYLLGGTSAAVASQRRDKSLIFDPHSPAVGVGRRPDTQSGMVKRSGNHEKSGEWNVAEVYTVGDRAVFLVNGQVVNALTDAKVKQGDKLVSLSKGKLQIQSEAAEVFYRRMQIRPIDVIPAEVLAQAGL